jgi:hypothetical protein
MMIPVLREMIRMSTHKVVRPERNEHVMTETPPAFGATLARP